MSNTVTAWQKAARGSPGWTETMPHVPVLRLVWQTLCRRETKRPKAAESFQRERAIFIKRGSSEDSAVIFTSLPRSLSKGGPPWFGCNRSPDSPVTHQGLLHLWHLAHRGWRDPFPSSILPPQKRAVKQRWQLLPSAQAVPAQHCVPARGALLIITSFSV